MASAAVPTTFASDPTQEVTLDDQFDFSSLYGEFRDEARDQIGSLDAALLRLEDEGELPEEERAALLRALHTLKGNAGMLGRTVVADAVHDLETAFKEMPAEWDREVLDSLFELAAGLRRAVERVGAEDEEAVTARLRRLRKRLAGAGAGTDSPDEDGDRAARRPEEGELEEPAGERLDDAAPLRHAPDHSRLRENGDGDETAERGGGDESGPDGARSRDGTAPVDGAGEIVRVPFASLDALLNRVGELVTLETRVDELVRRCRIELESAGLRRPLEDAAEGLARLSSSLHATTMELRLVPVRRVFERFRSVVRDLARQEGKRVRVETEGEEVRIDKAMADAISEPLLHLVRNAVDHGIESPEDRQAQGRDPTGTVRLRAQRVGDRVRIAVEDDGRGLDRAGILARARNLHLVGEDQSPDLDALGDLIFQPGFSTRTEATTVSGRGVGLDVVRRKAVALRGSLTVETPEGGGTRFVLDLPLTMAIVPAVLFESAGEVLAFASADVVETLRSLKTERAGGAEVVRRGDDLVPVARLRTLFGWTEAGEDERREEFGLVVRRGRRSIAVLADRLLDQRDVVVKALPNYVGALKAVSGVAVTNEALVLLLDVAGVLDLNLEMHRRDNGGT